MLVTVSINLLINVVILCFKKCVNKCFNKFEMHAKLDKNIVLSNYEWALKFENARCFTSLLLNDLLLNFHELQLPQYYAFICFQSSCIIC